MIYNRKGGEFLPSKCKEKFVFHLGLNLERCANHNVNDNNTKNRFQVRSIIARRRIESVNNQKLEDARKQTLRSKEIG